MTDKDRQLDAIEDALLELKSVERAGVFERTRVDAQDALRAEPVKHATRLRRQVVRWVPIAAAIGMIATVWTTMFDTSTRSSLPSPSSTSVVSTAGNGECHHGSFVGCFTGPESVIVASCLDHDYDADGDVDLVDFGAYQLECKKHN
ncbi:MAG: hypothetical protein JSU63_20405 [Phycisphaerales bacterium]|nr:MAG: hypothetical protein JSU63_20405 [Phycisphaerales bacterium]